MDPLEMLELAARALDRDYRIPRDPSTVAFTVHNLLAYDPGWFDRLRGSFFDRLEEAGERELSMSSRVYLSWASTDFAFCVGDADTQRAIREIEKHALALIDLLGARELQLSTSNRETVKGLWGLVARFGCHLDDQRPAPPKGRKLNSAARSWHIALSQTYRACGGTTAFPHKAGVIEGPFPRFLATGWELMPKAVAPGTPSAFIDLARRYHQDRKNRARHAAILADDDFLNRIEEEIASASRNSLPPIPPTQIGQRQSESLSMDQSER